MGVASYILLVWLVLQLLGRLYIIQVANSEPVAATLGNVAWFVLMIYMIGLSGGWN